MSPGFLHSTFPSPSPGSPSFSKLTADVPGSCASFSHHPAVCCRCPPCFCFIKNIFRAETKAEPKYGWLASKRGNRGMANGSAYVQGQAAQGLVKSIGNSRLNKFLPLILILWLILSSINCSFIVANCDFDFGVQSRRGDWEKTPTKNHKMLSVTIRKLSDSPVPTIPHSLGFRFEPFGVCQFTSWVP